MRPQREKASAPPARRSAPKPPDSKDFSAFFAASDGRAAPRGGERVVALQFVGVNAALYDAAPPDARAAFLRAVEVQLSVLADCSPARFAAAWDAAGVATVRIGAGGGGFLVDGRGMRSGMHSSGFGHGDECDDDGRSNAAIEEALTNAVRLRRAPLRIVRHSYQRDLGGGGGVISVVLVQPLAPDAVLSQIPPAPRPRNDKDDAPRNGDRQPANYSGETRASFPRAQGHAQVPKGSVASIMANVHETPSPVRTQQAALLSTAQARS